jgi:hypothetical protein
MKVGELIEKLSKLDQDKNVLVNVLGSLDLGVQIDPVRYYVNPEYPSLDPHEFEDWMAEPNQASWLFDDGVVPPIVEAYLIH